MMSKIIQEKRNKQMCFYFNTYSILIKKDNTLIKKDNTKK